MGKCHTKQILDYVGVLCVPAEEIMLLDVRAFRYYFPSARSHIRCVHKRMVPLHVTAEFHNVLWEGTVNFRFVPGNS
jgi:hypothetical protein